MNTLSWFIYLTQVADELRGAAGVTAIIVGIGFGGWLLFSGFALAMEDEAGPLIAFKKAARVWGVWLFAGCVALSIIVPSRQTLLLIAGSELGERLVQSDGVRSVVDPGVDLIREWMQSETERLRGSREDKK